MKPGSKAAYNLAVQSIGLNRPIQALKVLESLDPERGPMRGWTSYWYRVWDAYLWLGELPKALKAIQKGLDQYPAEPFLPIMELCALAGLGNVDEVRQLMNIRSSSPTDMSHMSQRFDVGVSDWLSVARAFHRYGHSEAALETIDRLLNWYESLPSEGKTTINNRSGYAYALMLSERWKEAGMILDELSAEYPESISFLGRLGIYAARTGDRERASSIITQLAGIDRPYLYGSNTFFQACINGWLGEKAEAVRLLHAAYRQGYAYRYELYFYEFVEPLWDYPAFQDFMKPRG